MNTPIIDAVGNNAKSWPILSAYNHVFDTARRLELDRAALMDALCEIHILSHDYSGEGSIALKAIEAARANFPTE